MSLFDDECDSDSDSECESECDSESEDELPWFLSELRSIKIKRGTPGLDRIKVSEMPCLEG